ncbi:hypothetical protein FRX31_005849 [Thalictrum thalictroides]|uniref:Uncharacterized protein n=1 Tax=Thalictrum thalictroides TaxID=46969 RepID=A0A7J6X4F7_THATH|nr:hypothetical protein FRX31_005849 [Thalictrum thalictroides]
MDMTKPSEDGWIILKPLEDDWIISIASKLGEEKTRKDLISLLTKENIEDVDGKKLIKNWLIQFLGSGYDTNGYDNFRLTLAQQLGKFVPYVYPSISIIVSGEDSVRLLAVEAFGKLLEPQDCEDYLQDIYTRLLQDECWRVRCTLVNQLCELCEKLKDNSSR